MRVIVVGLITSLILLVFAVFWFFGLLIGMNGVSESKATPILIAYIVFACVCAVASGILSGFGVKLLSKWTSWHLLIIAPLAVIAVSVAGVVILFFGSVFIMIVLGVK